MNAVPTYTPRGQAIADKIRLYVRDPRLREATVRAAVEMIDRGLPLVALCQILIEIERLRREGKLPSAVKYFRRRLAEVALHFGVVRMTMTGFEPGYLMVLSLFPGTFVPAVAVRLSLDRISAVHVN